MKRTFIVVASLALLSCSQEEALEQPAAASDADVVDTTLETRLVENPPVYESVPLPDGLEWVTNEDDPVFASPEAQRGGTFTSYITSFPLTLRMFGPDANTGTFVSIKRSIHMALLDLHPNTLRFLPSLATHWAIGPSGNRVYYRLDQRARWSDGVPVTADDYVFSREFRLSEYVLAPFWQNYFTNVITDIAKHDEYTISVELNTAKPGDELLYQTNLSPTPRHFHVLNENWVEDYNWRVEPNTGPYQISAVEKGRFIEFSRKDDWWANDFKYYQNRFNVDTIRIDIIRDENVAYEYFLRGELDAFDFTSVVPSR